jgi:hypothetical protein
LRFPEAAGLRFQETATSGSKNTQEKKYADEDVSKFETSHDVHFSEGDDSRPQAEVVPEGQEPASDAPESGQRPSAPSPADSHLSGPQNASNEARPERSASADFLAARAAIRSTLAARMRLAGEGSRRSRHSNSSPIPPEPPTTARPDRPGSRGRPSTGASDERDLVYAYLNDFNVELLHDEAPIASLVTQAINIFRSGDIPLEQWPDYLYRARTAVKEHAGSITKEARGNGAVKNRGPYYFAVLRNLVSPPAATAAASSDISHSDAANGPPN